MATYYDCKNELFQKKSKKGRLSTWNLKKLEKQNMEIPGVNKKRCGVSRGDKKDCEISMGSWSLVFGLGNSNANGWV